MIYLIIKIFWNAKREGWIVTIIFWVIASQGDKPVLRTVNCFTGPHIWDEPWLKQYKSYASPFQKITHNIQITYIIHGCHSDLPFDLTWIWFRLLTTLSKRMPQWAIYTIFTSISFLILQSSTQHSSFNVLWKINQTHVQLKAKLWEQSYIYHHIVYAWNKSHIIDEYHPTNWSEITWLIKK